MLVTRGLLDPLVSGTLCRLDRNTVSASNIRWKSISRGAYMLGTRGLLDPLLPLQAGQEHGAS